VLSLKKETLAANKLVRSYVGLCWGVLYADVQYLNPLKPNVISIRWKHSVPTADSITRLHYKDQLVDGVCFEKHTDLTSTTLCGQSFWFRIFILAILKMAVFAVVAPYGLVKLYRRFRGACCLHSRPEGGSELLARRNHLENIFLHTRRREDLKPHVVTFSVASSLVTCELLPQHLKINSQRKGGLPVYSLRWFLATCLLAYSLGFYQARHIASH
jgi:hypothetical protein